jgi:hypothetical protein
MKTIRLSSLALLTLVSGAFSFLHGAQEELTAAIQQSRTETVLTHNELVANLNALNLLVTQKEGDLRPAYANFKGGLDSTKAALERTQKRVTVLKESGEKYFSAWQADIDQIKSPDIRERAMKRLEKTQKNWNEVTISLQEATKQFPALLGYLSDVDTALNYDLTPDGVKSVRSAARSAESTFAKIQELVRKAVTNLEEMSADMSPTMRTGKWDRRDEPEAIFATSPHRPISDDEALWCFESVILATEPVERS